MSYNECSFDNITVIRDKISQINGQKIFRNPPESWIGEDPSRDCEIFVGRIPRDCSLEKELIPLFQQAGHLFEFRLMVQFSGCNRGYGFAMYTCVDDAQRAVVKFNNFTIRPSWQLGVCSSDNNCRLFMKRIPFGVSSLEVSKLIYENSDEVIEVYLKRSSHSLSLVTEYTNHRAAALARKTLVPLVAARWGPGVQVDWSKPDWYLDFTQYLEVGHRVLNQVVIRSIDKVKLRANFSCGRAAGRSAGRSRSSYRRDKMIREAQGTRSSSAENPIPGILNNSDMIDLSGLMLRYCVDQPSSRESGDHLTVANSKYRPILPERGALSLDRSSYNQHQINLSNSISTRQRPIVQPLDLTNVNVMYGTINPNSPMVISSQSSPSSRGSCHNQYFTHSQMSNMMDYDNLGNQTSPSPLVFSASPVSPWNSQLTPQSMSSPSMFRYPSSSNVAGTSSQSSSEGFAPDPSLSNQHEPIFHFSQSPKVAAPSGRILVKKVTQLSSEYVDRPLHFSPPERNNDLNVPRTDSFGVQSLLKNSGVQNDTASVSLDGTHSTESVNKAILLEYLCKTDASLEISKKPAYNMWGFSPKSDSP